jgi:hypothetical protein
MKNKVLSKAEGAFKKSMAVVFLAGYLFSCGTEKETTENTDTQDTTAIENYVGEETGTDPAGMPCGLQGYRDSAHVSYRGSDLRIMVRIDCPGEVTVPDDSIERTYANRLDKENIVTISLKGKKIDTSFILLKKYFADSLGAEFLTESVFGNTSFEEISGKEDFVFTSFIGRAYSDDGMVVKFIFNRKKGIKVMSTAYPEMGEGEVVQ